MQMLLPGEYSEFSTNGIPQLVLGQHAQNGFPNNLIPTNNKNKNKNSMNETSGLTFTTDLFGLLVQKSLGVHLLQPAGIPSMPGVQLIIFLVSGKLDVFCIDNNNIVTAIIIGRKCWLMLALTENKKIRHVDGGQTLTTKA